jgi:multidrug resistance efflux pump
LKRKIAIGITAAVLLAGAGMYKMKSIGDAYASEPLVLNTTTIQKRDISSTVNVSGNVYVDKSTSLKPEGKGYVNKLHVVLGQKVKKGEVLVEIDSKELEKSLERKLLNLDIEKERLKQYRIEGTLETDNALKNADIDLKAAEEKYNSNKALYDSGAISERDFKTSEDNYHKAKMSYDKAKNAMKSNSGVNRIKIQELTVKSAESEIEDLREKIAKKKIISPFDGIVSLVNFKENELYDESKLLIKVQNMDSRMIKTLIPESDINKLNLNQKVTVTSNALKGTAMEGIISSISPSTIKKDGKKIAYTEVIVTLKELPEGLREGFMVNLSILTADKKGVLSVESEALSTDIDGNMTLTKQGADGSEEKVIVKIGAESLMYTEILEGNITENDTIILNSAGSEDSGYMEENEGMMDF